MKKIGLVISLLLGSIVFADGAKYRSTLGSDGTYHCFMVDQSDQPFGNMVSDDLCHVSYKLAYYSGGYYCFHADIAGNVYGNAVPFSLCQK